MRISILILFFILLLSQCKPVQSYETEINGKTAELIESDKGQALRELLPLLEGVEHIWIHQSREGKWVIYPPLSSLASYVDDEPRKTLSKEIGELEHVRSMKLSWLFLTSLPKEISRLDRLDSLDVSFNYLNISDELGKLEKLENLKFLNICGNLIDTVRVEEWNASRPGLTIIMKLPESSE